VRDSKYGTALVIETSEFSGGYILGFRVDNLDEVFTEVKNLFKTYSQNPNFGVEVQFEEVETNPQPVPKIEDNLEIIDTGYTSAIALPTKKSSYAMNSEASTDISKILFSEEIGLAIERPSNGVSLE
jgi:Bardet-Biedl syndrome 5 protein